MSPSVPPSLPALMEAFRRCVTDISPLLHCQTLPPPHIANFAEYHVRSTPGDTTACVCKPVDCAVFVCM